MIRKIMESKLFRVLNRPLKRFYKEKHLSGYYFEEKIIGWLWAWKAVPFKLLSVNPKLSFPAYSTVRIHNAKNILFDKNDIQIFRMIGTYLNKCSAKIQLVRAVYIESSIFDIRVNYELNNLKNNVKGECTILKDYSWYGDESIVTKSFIEANLIIAGNCAEAIQKLR